MLVVHTDTPRLRPPVLGGDLHIGGLRLYKALLDYRALAGPLRIGEGASAQPLTSIVRFWRSLCVVSTQRRSSVAQEVLDSGRETDSSSRSIFRSIRSRVLTSSAGMPCTLRTALCALSERDSRLTDVARQASSERDTDKREGTRVLRLGRCRRRDPPRRRPVGLGESVRTLACADAAGCSEKEEHRQRL